MPMSAKPQFASPDALLPSPDYPAPSTGADTSDLTLGKGAPAPAAQPAKTSDPLSALKAMTEEEKIALFS